MWPPERSATCAPAELVIPLAKAFVKHIEITWTDFASLVEVKSLDGGKVEFITFDLQIGVPQRPVYQILSSERITVGFWEGDDYSPVISVNRPDFPDTPHQNLVPDGYPSVLCVDDRPWQDVRHDFTATELMFRIQTWFEKACEGALHGVEQPFDPVFYRDGPHELILTLSGKNALNKDEGLTVWATDERRRYVLVTDKKTPRGAKNDHLNVHVVSVDVLPQPMKRLRRTPRNLRQLVEFLSGLQVDLLTVLKDAVEKWITEEKVDHAENWISCILVSLPQVNPLNGEIGGSKPFAFVCSDGPGQIGVAMGLLGLNEHDDGKGIKYVKMLMPTITPEKLESISLTLSPVHHELDAESASNLAARKENNLKAVLVGAGALGSHIAEYLIREGQYRWTIVDSDDFLPHNIARHTLTTSALGERKVVSLAHRLTEIRTDAQVIPLCINALSPASSPELAKTYDEADIIIDAAASVPVSRYLSDYPCGARKLSAFFTPDGKAAVLMVESSDQSENLRSIEASYLREILKSPHLETHLEGSQKLLRYSGACRSLTSQIPETRVAILSGLLTAGMFRSLSQDGASLSVWTLEESGGVTCFSWEVHTHRITKSDWTISLPSSLLKHLAELRANALPNETGGPLVGTIDKHAKEISVVYALPAPTDSIGTPSTFFRGKRSLTADISAAVMRTGGQVRYVGEWHSHPRGASTHPSQTDIVQIGQLAQIQSMDGLPAVSIIVGDTGINYILGEII